MISKVFSFIITTLLDKKIVNSMMDEERFSLRVDCGDKDLLLQGSYIPKNQSVKDLLLQYEEETKRIFKNVGM